MRIEILSEVVRMDKDSSIAFNYGTEIVLLCVRVNVVVRKCNGRFY